MKAILVMIVMSTSGQYKDWVAPYETMEQCEKAIPQWKSALPQDTLFSIACLPVRNTSEKEA